MSYLNLRFTLTILAVIIVNCISESIYCGDDDCYEIIDLNRTSTKQEIRKTFRSLSLKLHPDINDSPTAEAEYMKVVQAYEILYDEELREEYHYYLDHPEERWRNRFRYYRALTKIDLRLVISGFLAAVSLFQWIVQNQMHVSALKDLRQSDKVIDEAKALLKRKAKESPKQQQQGNTSKNTKGSANSNGKKKQSKKEIRESEKRLLNECIDEVLATADIQGGYKPAMLEDLIGYRAILLPYTTIMYIHWNIEWYYKFTHKGEAYGIEEEIYLTKGMMEISHSQWNALEEDKRNELLDMKFYLEENNELFQKYKEEELKQKYGKRYKQYKRWVKRKDI